MLADRATSGEMLHVMPWLSFVFSLFKLTFSEFFPYSLLVFHNLYDGNIINYTNVDNGLETTAHCTIFVFKLLKYKTVGFKILKFIDSSVISTSLFTVS